MYKVIDPTGLEHAIEIYRYTAYGLENVAQCFPRDQRVGVERAVITALVTGKELPAGYRRIKC